MNCVVLLCFGIVMNINTPCICHANVLDTSHMFSSDHAKVFLALGVSSSKLNTAWKVCSN